MTLFNECKKPVGYLVSVLCIVVSGYMAYQNFAVEKDKRPPYLLAQNSNNWWIGFVVAAVVLGGVHVDFEEIKNLAGMNNKYDSLSNKNLLLETPTLTDTFAPVMSSTK